jgi:hypothetical protein
MSIIDNHSLLSHSSIDIIQTLEQIKNHLQKTHDIPNTKLRLYQLSIDTSLQLTTGQRGALNFFSAQHKTESEIIQLIDTIIKQHQSKSSSSSLVNTNNQIPELKHFSNDLKIEPIIKRDQDGYKWYLITSPFDATQNGISVDPKTYFSTVNVQKQADAFLEKLKTGDEKSWLMFGLSSWFNQNRKVNGCQIDLIKMGNRIYIIICEKVSQDITRKSSELNFNVTDQKTVYFTSKILPLEKIIDSKWLARGYVPNLSDDTIFYIVFALKENSNIYPMSLNMEMQLKNILCSSPEEIHKT